MTPKILLAVVVPLVLTSATAAWATLGQTAASVTADQVRLEGEVRSTARDGFTVHEITAADGGVVREYVSPAGQVFAVAWSGPTMPNLSALLGDYFPAFQQGARSAVRRRGPVVVRTEGVVIESGGHMRAFHGRAYLPDRVPATVSAAVVK